MRNFGKIFINFFLAIILTIVQFSFVNNLPGYYHSLNLVIVALIFVLALSGLVRAGWWSLGVGFALDFFYFTPFGLNTFGFLISIFIAYLLFHYIFTDQSIYSFLAIVLLTTFFSRIIIRFSVYLIDSVIGTEAVWPFFSINFWKLAGAEIVLNMLATFCLFYIVNSITKRLRPVFIK